jgi:NAD(P)-dependent dehydrogenase (short-subunit alcohol dehydrogenase family)
VGTSGQSLYQKRVLVIGAAGAIGQGVSRALRERGARVKGIDRQQGADIVQADIADSQAVQDAVCQVTEMLGGLDILINAAGIGLPQDAGAPPDDSVTKTLNVNLLGPWRVTAYALPALLASHGRIINIASGLAFANVPFAAAYSASKRALAAWSDVLRLEYGSQVSVTTIYPGYVDTPIHVPVEAAGLSLRGLVREEPLHAVVSTVVRACTGKPRRDLATTRIGSIEIGLARHFPALVDRIILARMLRLGQTKRYNNAPLALGMLKRMGVKQ